MSFNDQRAAQLLAMCNDIGEAAYLDSQVAANLLEIVRHLPSKDITLPCLASRYGFELEEAMTGWHTARQILIAKLVIPDILCMDSP